MNHAHADVLDRLAFERAAQRLGRAGDVGLDDDLQVLYQSIGNPFLDRLERNHGLARRENPVALGKEPALGHVTCRSLVRDDVEAVTGLRQSGKAEHLDRQRGGGFRHRQEIFVQQVAHPAGELGGDEGVAFAERAFLDEDSRDAAPAAVDPGLDDHAPGRAVVCCLQVLLERKH